MDFLEKDLEQIIYEATDEQLAPFSFPTGIRKRQLSIGAYGVADLVFFKRVRMGSIRNDNNGNPYLKTEEHGLCITVCELKKDKISISTFLQAIRYCKGISEYLEVRGFENYYFNILLIGRDIDHSNNFIYLTDMVGENIRYSDDGGDFEENISQYCYFSKRINSLDFKTYSYYFDGIKFKSHSNYNLPHSGF